MFYAKWMKDLSKMDTKLTKAQRHKDLWYLFEISGAIVCWEPRYYIWNLIYIGILVSAQLYFLPCMTVSMFKVDEVAEFGQYLNIVSLTFISLTMIITSHRNRKSILTLSSMKAQGFYDYGDTLDLTELKKLHELFNIMGKVLLVVLPTWLILIASSFILSEYVDAIFGYNTTVTSDYVNDIYQHLPVKMWFFHTIDSEFKWYISLVIQMAGASGLALSITCANIFFITTGQNLIIEMKTLVKAMRDTDSRADRHYTLKTGKKPSRDPIMRKKDPELMKSYRACIKQTMEHHKTIIFAFKLDNDICNWPTGMCVLNGAILMSMSTISLMKGDGRPSVTVTSILLIVAEITLLFVMCEFGQTFRDLSEEMFYAMYRFRWSDCTKEVTTDIRFMMTNMSKPLILYGLITPLNRDTFATMLNTAYSYINLVRAS